MLLRKRLFKWLFVEFIIVFIGVYMAFLAGEWQERRKDREIQAKYYQSLIFEFEKFKQHLDEENAKLTETYLPILDEIDAGNQPDLAPPDLYYLYRGPVLAAAFNAKNFESLDLDLLHSIARGTFLLDGLKARTEALNRYTETILLPALAAGRPEFYDSEGKLKPGYAWYPRLVREIHILNRQLHTVVADFALPDLRRQLMTTGSHIF